MIKVEDIRDRPDKSGDNVKIIVGTSNSYLINIAPLQFTRCQSSIDRESVLGRFGWFTFELKHHIPYITRAGEKYCAVRIVETKLLAPYLASISCHIFSHCVNIETYRMTEPERRLLNEINSFHCDHQFGKIAFSQWDLIMRLDDAVEFYKFLGLCYKKLYNVNVLSGNCGFISIDDVSVVPYVLCNEEKYMPLFYFEGAEHLHPNAKILKGWDLSYLKFCYKIQGIRNEYLMQETCAAVSMSDIKQYFPCNTVFRDFWPSNVAALRQCPKSKHNTTSWYRKPNLQESNTSVVCRTQPPELQVITTN